MTVDFRKFRGGSDNNDEVVLALGDTHILHPDERYCVFACSGGAGDPVKLILPNAVGLPISLFFPIIFISSTADTEVFNWGTDGTDGTKQTVYDAKGIPQTLIDHAVANWGLEAAIEARLIDNVTGLWTIYSWSKFG